jgi:hypothetical protein
MHLPAQRNGFKTSQNLGKQIFLPRKLFDSNRSRKENLVSLVPLQEEI